MYKSWKQTNTKLNLIYENREVLITVSVMLKSNAFTLKNNVWIHKNIYILKLFKRLYSRLKVKPY